MYRMLLSKAAATIFILLLCITSYAQTTVTTGLAAATTTSSPGAVTFAVRNNNSFPIALTQFATFHNSANNGRVYTVWYHPTALTGAPSVTTANGWIQVGSSAAISGSSAITTILTNKYLVMQANATYRFAITINTGNMYYSGTGATSYTNGSVDILTGNNAVSPTYAGTFPSPATANVYFSGSVTFVTASVNNVGGTVVVSPLNGSQICYNTPTLVRAVINNNGASPQSNIPVSATYVSSSASNTISTTYAGPLAPFTSDTVNIGIINPAGGNYTIRAYTTLSSDTVRVNDTTPTLNFTYKAMITPPVTNSDTVCPGQNAQIFPTAVASTVYRWYSAATGGTLQNIGNNMVFTPLTQDTILYVAAQFNGCESERSMIAAILGTPPVVNLGPDTSFCESIPLLLDAGNPGARYLWSTGDTTQTITVSNQSGNYAVIVDKYCAISDTIAITIAPLPTATGISYIRNDRTYQFSASSVSNVTGYLWIFGDGNTSTLPNPTHTYALGINVDYVVKLVVMNDCGTDTVFRLLPTDVNNITLSDRINVYPNPATDQVHISSPSLKIESVQVINLTGSVVLSKGINKLQDVLIDTRHLAPGNYILRLHTSAGDIRRPLQVIR